MRAALSIPLAGRGPRTEGRRVLSAVDQRSLVNAVLAWAITYGGVLLGSALLGTIDNRTIAALVLHRPCSRGQRGFAVGVHPA